MDISNVINSALGVGTAICLGRIFPRKIGYKLADVITGKLSQNLSSKAVQVIRANQWIVSGRKMSAEELDARAIKVMQANGRCIFDFYHLVGRSKRILEVSEIDPEIAQYFNGEGRNAMFVAPHISNFDMIGQALGILGFRLQILSYPNPGSGYKWQNRIRENCGHIITPTSMQSLKEARIRLQRGENVLTGLDRPIESGKYQPMFFNEPASLPVTYTRLALEANVPVVVVSAITKPDGKYYLFASKPITMKKMPDLHQETIRNAEAVLEVAEEIIKQYADQWSMFYPIWPQLLPNTP